MLCVSVFLRLQCANTERRRATVALHRRLQELARELTISKPPLAQSLKSRNQMSANALAVYTIEKQQQQQQQQQVAAR